MGVTIKPIIDLANLAGKIAEKITERSILEYQRKTDRYVAEANQRVALEFAKSIGLHPVAFSDWEVRRLLMEKIIQLIKEKKLTQINIALSVQTSRTRISALMNRHIEEFKIDSLIHILSVLGVSVKIEISDS
jgi:predicted XRE-type DNA-binding protein